jgi:hypothetical protein
MAISWYSISISLYPSDTVIFNGYLSTDGTDLSNNIQGFYDATDITFSNNLLLPEVATFDSTTLVGLNNYNTQSNNTLLHDASGYYFPLGGTIISSIMPELDTSFNATEWALWRGTSGRSRLSYFSDGSWNNLPATPNAYINEYVIVPIIDPSCFNEGTKILCLNKEFQEEYIPIENLRKGDLVKSYKHGYRKIDRIGKNPMINDPNNVGGCMFLMKKTEENGLIEDLIVTGGHALLVDDLGEHKEANAKFLGSTVPMIDDKYLLICNVAKQFVKLENNNLYTYYHFTLENNGDDEERFGVWANGALTETPSKRQFSEHIYTLL